MQILLNRMSQVNHFQQEQQNEPDHANNVNQTGCPVTNMDRFSLEWGRKQTLLMNNYIKRKKNRKGTRKATRFGNKIHSVSAHQFQHLIVTPRFKKAMWVNKPGTQIWCTSSRWHLVASHQNPNPIRYTPNNTIKHQDQRLAPAGPNPPRA
jgi:hypothetical protein